MYSEEQHFLDAVMLEVPNDPNGFEFRDEIKSHYTLVRHLRDRCALLQALRLRAESKRLLARVLRWWNN